jgi:hypothetical protein
MRLRMIAVNSFQVLPHALKGVKAMDHCFLSILSRSRPDVLDMIRPSQMRGQIIQYDRCLIVRDNGRFHIPKVI